jgi:hypothetical protein
LYFFSHDLFHQRGIQLNSGVHNSVDLGTQDFLYMEHTRMFLGAVKGLTYNMKRVKKWVPKELDNVGWLSKVISSPDEFGALLEQRVDVWQGEGIRAGGERTWLIKRLTNRPERISSLAPAGRRMFPGMNDQKLMDLLKALHVDGYLFCKLANRAGKRTVRSWSLYIRGSEGEPWANCPWCPAFESCTVKEKVKS